MLWEKNALQYPREYNTSYAFHAALVMALSSVLQVFTCVGKTVVLITMHQEISNCVIC